MSLCRAIPIVYSLNSDVDEQSKQTKTAEVKTEKNLLLFRFIGRLIILTKYISTDQIIFSLTVLAKSNRRPHETSATQKVQENKSIRSSIENSR